MIVRGRRKSCKGVGLGLASEGGGLGYGSFLGCFSCEGGLGVVSSALRLQVAAVRCVYPRLPRLAVGITADVRSKETYMEDNSSCR